MNERILIILLPLLIALGPVFWFPIIGKVIIIKAALTIIVSIVFFSNKKNKLFNVNLSLLLLIFILYFFAINNYNATFYQIIVNVYFDLLIAWLLFSIGQSVDSFFFRKIIVISLFIVVIYCIVFFRVVYSNGILYFPLEYAPTLSNGIIAMIPFSESGWGFGRTQWSTCLSVFIPCIFFLKDKLKLFLCCFAIIFAVQLISSGRGGILASLLSVSFLSYYQSKNKCLFFFFFSMALFVFTLFFHYFSDFYRLSGDNLTEITAYRNLQWEVLPQVIENLPFWGFGDFGGSSILEGYGVNELFHNSFIRIILGYGFAGICETIIVLLIIIQCMKNFQGKGCCYEKRIAGGILFAGFVCSFTEPTPIIVSSYWFIWWFSAGFLFKKENEFKKAAPVSFIFKSQRVQTEILKYNLRDCRDGTCVQAKF